MSNLWYINNSKMVIRPVLIAIHKFIRLFDQNSNPSSRRLISNVKTSPNDNSKGNKSFEKTPDFDKTVATREPYILTPPDPWSCCGLGCDKCVMIEYASKLVEFYSDRPLHEALDEIDKQLPSISYREFVKSELIGRAKRSGK